MTRGKFIALEGGEGAGKSTQARWLRDFLQQHGKEVVLTREPGGTPAAEEIRAMLVTGAKDRWTPLSETLLFLAARAHHVETLIKPALERGAWVITDRFTLSTIVYQGIAKGVGIDTVRKISRAAFEGFAPDLTIILDVEPEVGLRRAAGRGQAASRFEKENLDFHKRLRAGYHQLALTEPHIALVGATIDADTVASIIQDIVWNNLRDKP